eukprot:9306932-Alexandrium_andersonii.AAC.1
MVEPPRPRHVSVSLSHGGRVRRRRGPRRLLYLWAGPFGGVFSVLTLWAGTTIIRTRSAVP